jgi:hypothetical protein
MTYRPARLTCTAVLLCPLLLWAAPDALTPDGGRYFGPLHDAKLHGAGRLEWDNGARYEGEFAEGLFHGKGVLHYASGDVYEGEFRNGLMWGQGTLRMRNGTLYTGAFLHDDFNGHGRFVTRQGEIFEGEFKDGDFQGQGTHIRPDAEYRGEFADWRYQGEGELKYRDGSVYRGGFADGQYQGKGRLEREGGEAYEGEFVAGAFTGAGTYSHPSGVRHTGKFTDWRPNGFGRFTTARGDLYEGDFAGGRLEGAGRYVGKDGALYEGTFKDWRYHGQGRLRKANGDLYVGSFEEGLYEGAGTLTYAKARMDGQTEVRGLWHDGEPATSKEERQTLVADQERALYLQRALLDRAFAELAPSDPARINMYVLAVAGDGKQEVFRREVEYVRDQFANRYGTGGRTLTLINSRTTFDRVPMATVTSIREALSAIAARMDPDKDVLFLFLSSHGSKEHELSLDQRDMNLRDLRPAELGAMLKDAGIRWKVVVVSACYSGGFIEPLKDDHSLIVTAARADRRSFGCSDENDFTYFGEAFFKEALPGSTSFPEAFRNAQQLVNARELSDLEGKEPPADHFSLPQMHSAEPVERHLERWWAGLKDLELARSRH